VPVSAPFQASDCEKLGFEPKLFLRVLSGTRRTKHPKLRAVFVAREGDANPARVAVTLPRDIFLDQASISRVCTRVQFAAHECPPGSIYGYARAYTPLLDRPLEGPVYLRSSDNPLPDLVAALHGQVDIELDGRTDTVGGRIRNTFEAIPDVPVSAFVLTLRGGRSGLLINSHSLCPRRPRHHRRRHRKAPPLRAAAEIVAQNGKTANQSPKLRVPCRARQ
ncbi:MAG TPA: hypothetical protein VFP23_10695, partial [Solirubrobacterales bacterium]|nr:hypothetical protein [Solirubrobacterales bacterium]